MKDTAKEYGVLNKTLSPGIERRLCIGDAAAYH